MKIGTPLILAFALLAVSTASIIARWIDDVPALAMTFWRMGTGSLMLWFFSSKFPQGKLSIQNRIRTIIAGVFLGLHFACFFAALKFTYIANATFLATVAPVFTLLFERLFYKRSLTRNQFLGMILAFSGAIVIGTKDFSLDSSQTMGNLLALSSSFWFAITFLLTEQVRREGGTIAYSRLVYLSAAVTVLLIILLIKDPLVGFERYEYFGLLMLGLIPTILGHSLLYYSVKFYPASIVLTIPLGEPIVASSLAWIIFNEQVSTVVILGGILTLIGIFSILKEQAGLSTG